MRHIPILKIILIVWVVFSVLYVGYSQYNYLVKVVYTKGLSDAVVKVIQQAQECKAFPVYISNTGVQLINAACVTGATTSTDSSATSTTGTSTGAAE